MRIGALWLAAVAVFYVAAIRTTGDTWAAYYHVASAPAAAILIGAGLAVMRERREGLSEADLAGARDREGEKPIVRDPVLARALDLLKGLAVVGRSHS